MGKLKIIYSKITSTNVIFSTFAVISLILVLYLAFVIPSNELKGLLQSLSQLNISVAIGMGTLAIAFKANINVKTILVKEILLTMMISVLSFLLSYINNELVQRVYIGINGLVLISTLIFTANYITENGRGKQHGNRKRNRRKK